MEGNELQPAGNALTARDVRDQVNLIQEVMNSVMRGPTKDNPHGVHFGLVPGCGDKPTLLKPGAEKLALVFKLHPIIDNDRDIRIVNLPDGHREVTVFCHIMSGNVEVATGVGSCSTMESKYRYRGGEKTPTETPVPKEYWNLSEEGKKNEALAIIGGRGFGVMKHDGKWVICEKGEKMENPDIADTYNTVLKIAKKRAFVDGILTATGSSDFFTQDLEDMPQEHGEHPEKKTSEPKPMPEAKDTPQPDRQPETPTGRPLTPIPALLAIKKAGGGIPGVAGLLKARGTHKTPRGTPVHDFTLVDQEGNEVVISTWDEYKNVKVHDEVIAADVTIVALKNGKLVYSAKSLELIDIGMGEPNG